MNGITKERDWAGYHLLTESYTKSKTIEKVLAVTFLGSYHIVRQFKVMVFPTVFLRIPGVFAYVPAMFLPWRYTWLVPGLVLFTSVEPVGSFFALTAGIQVAYFTSRLFKRYRLFSLLLATIASNLVAYTVRASMGLIPPDVAYLFYVYKTMITASGILVLSPMILKILEYKKLVNFNKD